MFDYLMSSNTVLCYIQLRSTDCCTKRPKAAQILQTWLPPLCSTSALGVQKLEM